MSGGQTDNIRESYDRVAAEYAARTYGELAHKPLDRELLPAAFADMRRTLRPGSAALLAFHIGAADRHLDEWWGEQVSLDFYFFQRPTIEQHLIDAGFVIHESIERLPYPDVEAQTERACILAAKPARATPA